MADIRFATQAKSDQLNAVDIQGAPIVIRINQVKTFPDAMSQQVWVYYDGCNNKPWKPSKGMIRLLEKAWGYESDNWLNKSAKVFCDPDAMYAGKKQGGIRIEALSDITKSGFEAIVVHNRQKRELVKIAYLDTSRPEYPSEKFTAALPKMIEMMNHEDQEKRMNLTQIIAHCQKTGDLTKQQLERLEKSAPIETDGEM